MSTAAYAFWAILGAASIAALGILVLLGYVARNGDDDDSWPDGMAV